MASQRRAGVGSRGRQLVDALTPWLAAAVNLSYALAAAARAGARAVAVGVDRAESLVVPLLVTLTRGTARALAVVVHLLADAVEAAARSAACAASACVEGLAEPLARHGPRLWRAARPGLVRLGVATSRGLVGAVAVVALGLATSGPALQLAARTVRADLSGGEHEGLPPLAEPSVVVAADGTVLAELHDGVDREVVALQRVPAHVRHAVLAAEDQRFYEHRGYDLAAIGRALWTNLRARAVRQGASTITQQLAKQNLVGDAQTLGRKVDELVHAVALEQRFSKDQLLERYLNEVYLGSGAYGIAAAASEYFGVAPEGLTVSQGALLAGLVRSPVALDPRRNPHAATARRNEVLDAMAALGLLPAEQAARLRAEPLQVVPPAARQTAQPFVLSAVRREFLADPAFGASQAERVQRLYSGGLRIETTIDPRLQAAAAEAVAAYTRAGGPTAAVAAVEPASGRIRALHSGADFARVRFDPATQGRRPPGSVFKPLVAAAALEAGHHPSLPLPGDGPVAVAVAGQAGPWVVDNHNGADYGAVDLATALSESINTAFATLGARLGHQRLVDVAGRLGIDVERAFGPPTSRGPAAALGGLTHGVSPLELAGAYAVFANGGMHEPSHLIERVTGPDGRPVLQRAPQAIPALDPGVNAALVGLLQEVVAGGTGVRARLPGWEALGKTGTTQ
ncbi:MAG TPA: transglycosylase domain-containing protein [Egibacteraceae bacterium]|nr:transglycosylase domain-containing protein [Egibacteraceae bacterium]